MPSLSLETLSSACLRLALVESDTVINAAPLIFYLVALILKLQGCTTIFFDELGLMRAILVFFVSLPAASAIFGRPCIRAMQDLHILVGI